MNAIVCKGLKKIYKKKAVALEHLDLSVPAGCVFGLIGPNGAGKSSLINILAGIVQKDAGEVFLLGEKVNDFDFEYKRNIGFVLERPVYLEKLTPQEYLEFAAAMHGIEKTVAEKRIEELLQFFVLYEKRNDLIETLSTGMKKKVSLATAIIHRPRLLILDEPLEGIDPLSSKTIKDNLRLMAEKGVTVFLSSHDLNTVEKLCDQIAIISKGKIFFQGTMDDLRRKTNGGIVKDSLSLEEIFLAVISEKGAMREPQKLSWL